FMVYFDPLIADYDFIAATIENLARGDEAVQEVDPGGIVVPVAYGGEYGPDISHVADLHNITAGDVARIHSAPVYMVHMLGFTPGFPYLGGMDTAISAPRKSEPALHIEAGSVGIAGDQTGIYPVESPGGWQIIGRTPLVLFDPHRQPEFLFSAGMKVRFKPVDNYEFWSACEMISNGEYEYERF
ncbi:MAG: 5-oxoprolinase subunit PxpB, partial [Bacteroidales bacterium]|nr:5-oxoprolinase subunit PxpB [Bacteroidales bacterium]